MIPSKLIKQIIPAVKTSLIGYNVLSIMDEYKVSHLAIVNESEYLGIICETDLFNNDLNEPIGTYRLTLNNAFVKVNSHIFDTFRLATEMKLTVIPVIDSNNCYLGSISSNELLNEMGQILSINSPGAIIEIEINILDYHLSEIIRLIETNDTKVLNVSAQLKPETNLIIITIKLNKVEISSVIQTLNRYDYRIIDQYGIDEMQDYLKDRFDSLMHFLNI